MQQNGFCSEIRYYLSELMDTYLTMMLAACYKGENWLEGVYMKPIASEAEFNEIISQDKPTLAVFKADWCKDCHFIDPFMPEVEKKYDSSLSFIVVDRDQFPELCEHYNILGIPSFIMFRNGQEVTRFVSKLRKTREEIEQYLDKSLQVAQALKA